MKQLQHLSLTISNLQLQPLLQLSQQLPALQHLELQYGGSELMEQPAAATASAWALLPQLHDLDISFGNVVPVEEEWEAIITGVAAATSLTRLSLKPCMLPAERQPDVDILDWEMEALARVEVCASLTALTRLKSLTIDCELHMVKAHLARGDALALTALTSLTSLSLVSADDGVGATAATALANSLQQLQHLRLFNCWLRFDSAEGMACLAAIGRLTQLTYLDLRSNPELTPQGLMQLRGLSRLQVLEVSRRDCIYSTKDVQHFLGNEVQEEDIQAFLAAVRQT